MSNTDRAQQNSEYVRRMLKKKSPEFAAVLERVVAELTCPGDAPSAESPAFELRGRVEDVEVAHGVAMVLPLLV